MRQKKKLLNILSKIVQYMKKKGDLTLYLYEGKEFTYDEEKNCKTLMVVGQTGSGKTTFLNALINYYLNVDFDLNHHIIGYNISIIIPNILKLIKIDSDKNK